MQRTNNPKNISLVFSLRQNFVKLQPGALDLQLCETDATFLNYYRRKIS